ncbi:MAG: 2-phospho-L-lactate transferase [Actinomycetota bacterium]|nr:2-phospho-L-lactate transferase [Actinomycetota bacterium]
MSDEHARPSSVLALAGGVGAARFLRGLSDVIEPDRITAIVNTGDDIVLHGLHVSPDLDTVMYTLAGAVNPETGWGLTGETWNVMDALERLAPTGPTGSMAGMTWFRLGDRDLATHLYRTQRLREGAPLSAVTAELRAAWRVGVRLVPMTDDPVETRVVVAGEGEIGFQDYFVRLGHSVRVEEVRFAGATEAAAAPDVLDGISSAQTVVICPSNPIVSVGPILAVAGIADALGRRRETTIAISPIIAGQALKGPAARLMSELGHEPSVIGVARIYAPFVGALIIDEADRELAPAVEAEGMRCVVAPTVMHGAPEAAALAVVVLGVASATAG